MRLDGMCPAGPRPSARPVDFDFHPAIRLQATDQPGRGLVADTITDRRDGASVWKKSDKPFPAEPREAKLTAAQMDRLLGNYELAPGFVLTFSRKENQMFVQATGQSAFEIYPVSETKFFMKVVPASCEFILGGNGAAKEVLWTQGGQTTPGKKL